MKHVLFVDDEPQILTFLKASMAPLREEWEMEFLESGEQALSWLEDHPTDAVLADIHLVGMGGLQLLGEVKSRYPQIIRIAFSGCAHTEMVLKGLVVAHQVLPKPLAPTTLRETLDRACVQRDVLKRPALQQLVSAIHQLPSLPTLYQELESALRAPDSSADTAAAIIAKDPAMVANLLHAVNSAYFSLRRTIASPAHAAALLGLDTVKSLVLSLKVLAETRRTPAVTPLIEELWKHGVVVGTTAKWLASREGLGTVGVERAFLAGLLHDLGRLVLASNLPGECAQVEQVVKTQSLPHQEAEHHIFGATHADVGAYLLSVWGLHESIVEAVAYHHVPAEAPSRDFTVLTAVHAANAWTESVLSHRAAGEPDPGYVERLGLVERAAKWRAVCTTTR